ncbi:signal peptidase II [cyanobiont of Ornithocercus magnificus]|nr:signal peptidase II [cyanobiont of Ornithocercus magnificus]
MHSSRIIISSHQALVVYQVRVLPSLHQHIILLILSMVFLLIDQISKYWARSTLLPGSPKPFLPGLVQLRLVNNTGAAFGLFSNATPILGLLSLFTAIALLIWLWYSSPLPFWQAFAITLLLAGTLGNGIDRWRLGYVTDFLEFIPIYFAVFNGADIAINGAVVCFTIDYLSRRK